MDPNVRDVLVATLPIIGGVLVGILVAKITADRSRQLEREKWKRELYASFIHSASEVRDAAHLIATGMDPGEHWGSNLERAQRDLVEIKIIAPSMRGATEAVWTAITNLMKAMVKLNAATPTPSGAAIPIDLSRYQELDAPCRLTIQAFIDRASAEFRG